MNLFGKKKKEAAPRLSDSIQMLRESMSLLDKREKHLEKQMLAAQEEAKKKAKAKDKRGALFHLKRKKMFEKQLDHIAGQKMHIEMQVMTLESAASNKEILGVMKTGQQALSGAVKDSDVEKVAEIMDDINESIGIADELGEAMAQPIGPQLDEDELAQELEELESEVVDTDLLKAPVVPVKAKQQVPDANEQVAALPAAPANESSDDKEARELKELEALME